LLLLLLLSRSILIIDVSLSIILGSSLVLGGALDLELALVVLSLLGVVADGGLEGGGELAGDGGVVDQDLGVVGESGDLSGAELVEVDALVAGEQAEPDLTGLLRDRDIGLLVDGLDDEVELILGVDVGPAAALAAVGAAVGMLFDVEKLNGLAHAACHGGDDGVGHLSGTLTAELTDEETESTGVTGLATLAAVAVGGGAAEKALPRHVAVSGAVLTRSNEADVGVNGSKVGGLIVGVGLEGLEGVHGQRRHDAGAVVAASVGGVGGVAGVRRSTTEAVVGHGSGGAGSGLAGATFRNVGDAVTRVGVVVGGESSGLGDVVGLRRRRRRRGSCVDTGLSSLGVVLRNKLVVVVEVVVGRHFIM